MTRRLTGKSENKLMDWSRIRNNQEVDELLKHDDIVRIVKAKRIQF